MARVRCWWSDAALYSKELRDIVGFKLIEQRFLDQGWEWTDVDSSGEASAWKDDLETLAYGDTTSGAIMARNVISLVEDTIFPSIYLEPTDTSSSKRSIVEESTLADELEERIQFRVYPNPAQDKLVVEYHLGNEAYTKPLLFEVYNLAGAVVASYTLDPSQRSVSLNISDLDNGFYLYRISSDDALLHNNKILIMK